eukprot:gnl/TRDRNA2_/TRDRNA2_171221_c1_seq2.p1 gnl/TRDRNA2_/TRDRNA2_171221_c1~~gnl/TRDRNA2_/TRDRNA2_171221_c1_seq2.p1  ORF type:complete len:397 (-),score=64.56 gnl/TRDRNA2_/TRDRNA2_171221_c1_seq2:83-1273(-)
MAMDTLGRPECAASWAMHYVKFIKAMAEVGVNIWAVSVQNEPEASQSWESCIYTAEEERNFVRDHLGPTLAKENLSSVNILVWDHNRQGMLERAARAYEDPEAAKYIWGMGYHWYGDACFDNVRQVAELCPEKHILFTEGCSDVDSIGHWSIGETYAENIIKDLNAGTEGWIDWNLFLNETGGPNHVDNNCAAPIICDTRTDSVQYLAAYWYLGHFSRYIKPGATRVLASSSRDALKVVSFLNPDGSLVVVVMNQEEHHVGFWLKILSSAVQTMASPRSITTYVLDELDVEEGEMLKRAAELSLRGPQGGLQPELMDDDQALREALRLSMQDLHGSSVTPNPDILLSASKPNGIHVGHFIPGLSVVAIAVVLLIVPKKLLGLNKFMQRWQEPLMHS